MRSTQLPQQHLDHSLKQLLAEVRACRVCALQLPLGPLPLLRASATARLLIAGQAPGRRAHLCGIPWDDPSGDRLRLWMGVDRPQFYDERLIAIIPAGFCYPGSGRSGDLPPRKECAELWLERLLQHMPQIRLTLLIGQYAQREYLGSRRRGTLTETVRAWREFLPEYIPLPHPSGRNNVWLKRNPWFDEEVLPYLRRRCQEFKFVEPQ